MRAEGQRDDDQGGLKKAAMFRMIKKQSLSEFMVIALDVRTESDFACKVSDIRMCSEWRGRLKNTT